METKAIAKVSTTSGALPLAPLARAEELRQAFAQLAPVVNLLTPVASIDAIPACHAISLRAVSINADPRSGDVYADRRFCKDGEFALSGQGLQKIMAAAGVQVLGKTRLDDRSDPNYCDMEVTLGIRDYDGECRQVIAGKEVNLRDGAPEALKHETDKNGNRTGKLVPLEPTALADRRRHIQSLAETKALNRALRKLLQLQQKYTREQLARPFVVPKLVPNLDPDVPEEKAALIAMATGTAHQLYGFPRELPARTLRDVTPHATVGNGARPEAEASGPTLHPQQVIPGPETQPEEDDYELAQVIHVCTCPCDCQAEINAEAARITAERVGAPRCRSCFPGKGFDYPRHHQLTDLRLPLLPGWTPDMVREANRKR